MSDTTRNVFVSHIHEDDDEIGKLKSLLRKRGFQLRDYSVSEENPNNAHNTDYIRQKILKPRLDASSVLAVIVTPETKDSEHVAWEIEYAQRHGKRIVCIYAHGEAGCEEPEPLKDYADARVPWDSDKIIRALEGENIQEDGQGVPQPTRQLKPPNC